MKITGLTDTLNPLKPAFDEILTGFAGSIVGALGILCSTNENTTSYVVPNELADLNIADLLISKGVSIENYPAFIEIESKDDDNAFGVMTNIDGELPRIMTWTEWKRSNHRFYEADGRIFIGTNAHTNQDMKYEDLVSVRANLVLGKDLPVVETVL